MTHVSKVVADRLGHGEQVTQAIEVQQRAVIDGIAQRVAVRVPEGLGAFVGWLAALLVHAIATLREADLAYGEELADDDAARSARDEATAALRGILLSARSAVGATYGEAFASNVGLDASVVVRADQLANHGAHVARLLRKHPAPAPNTPGIRVDLRELADGIDARATALQSALGSVRREDREAQATLSARDAALERYARTYSGVGEIFAGLCTLAGLDDLAAKLRPTHRRRIGLPDAPSEPEAPEPAEPAAS